MVYRFNQKETHIWKVLMEHMMCEYGRNNAEPAIEFRNRQIHIKRDLSFPETGLRMKKDSICRILTFDKENPGASLYEIVEEENDHLLEETDLFPEIHRYYYLIDLDARKEQEDGWIGELCKRMKKLDPGGSERFFWDISMTEKILEQSSIPDFYRSYLPSAERPGAPESGRKGLETVERYLEKCFMEDRFSRMEQAGSVTDEKVKLQKVFVDLEICPDEEVHPESGELFIEEMIRQGDHVNRFLKPFLPEDHLRKVDYLLLGTAGQGKSTVCQYLIQIYRASFLEWLSPYRPREEVHAFLEEYRKGKEPGFFCHRIPVHVIIKEYAAWMQKKTEGGGHAGVLSYIEEQIYRKTGENLSLDVLRILLKSMSWLFVFDGLDEVPSSSNRERVVSEIRDFIYGELRRNNCDNLLICTSRPQGNLEGLNREEFYHLRLMDLSPERCMDYLEKLMEQMSVSQDEKDRFMAVLGESVRDPVVSRLMKSPLQATIVAILVKTGGKPPRDRYNLFDTYYQTMKNREKQKETLETLHDTLDWMDELHYRLALKLQRESESDQNPSAVISGKELMKLICDYLKETDDEIDADSLGSTFSHILTERLCFITDLNKEGEYMFSIRSMQEFLAANGVVRQREAEVIEELNKIAASAYWRNVFLFAIGYLNKYVPPLEEEVRKICEQLNGCDCTPAQYNLEKISMEGSLLALDILKEGIYKGTAKSEKKYFDLFFQLKDREIVRGIQECSRLAPEKKEYLKKEYILPQLKREPENKTLWYLYGSIGQPEEVYEYLRGNSFPKTGLKAALEVIDQYFSIWSGAFEDTAAACIAEYLEVPENWLNLSYTDCCKLLLYGNFNEKAEAERKVLQGLIWNTDSAKERVPQRRNALEKLPGFWEPMETVLNRFRRNTDMLEIPQVFVIFVVDNDMDADETESFREAAKWFEQKGIDPEAAFLRMILTPDYDHLEKYLHTLWKEEPEIRRRWLEIHGQQHYLTEWLVRTYTIRELVHMSPDEILPSLHWDFTAAYRDLRTALEEKDWEKIWSMEGMFNATSSSCPDGIRIYLEKQGKSPEGISKMSDLELAYLLFVGAINLQKRDLSTEEEQILDCAYEEYRKREQTVPWGNLWARRIALYLANQKDALTLMSSSDDYHAFFPTEEHSYLYRAKPLLSQELKELTSHVIWMLQEIKEEHAIFRMLPALLICSVKTEWALPTGRYRHLLSIHCSEPLKELGRLLFLMMVPDWNPDEIKELGGQIVRYLEEKGVQDTLLFLRLGETYDAERSVKDPIYQDIYEYLMRPEYDGDEMAEKSRSRLCELARQKIESGKRRIVGDDI